ncbi:glycosyltransferase [Clostridium sp. CS001]|uniref:glycosyltransferase family 2 protein n=1 Tax=Clostridium sp. CS001 TaxID=2880648 RepID=UPI001CF49355|nr:glycosyltransferase family 2 protein [Clostridium sp. CS001]MCB2290346.1 glycosyltransferase [Clostridium sp. CS001]
MNNEEKKRNRIFIVTIILMTIYLGWRMIFTLPLSEGPLNIIFGILLIVAETVTVFTTFELLYQKMQINKFHLECPIVPDEYYPDVDVFISTHNESVDILYKTVNACTFMDYPDKSKVHIYLCDDGNREEVAILAKQFGVGYFGLSGNKDAKSGNLNNALKKTSSPLIATFDSDMIPQHTFLMKTVPYFFLSKFIKEDDRWRLRKEEEVNGKLKIGLIQTPQSFYNPDLFQFNLYAEGNIPNEQDFFSKEINTMRNASNAVAYTGSNTVIARVAMDEIGGFPLNTITEDFETSIRIQKAGYITYATDEIQAAGLTTTTIKSMIKQRVRWARGVIQSLQNTNAIFTSELPMVARITYFNSFLYWWSFFNRLIFILAPIMFALFGFQIVNSSFWDVVIFWLPAYFFYSMSMRYLSSDVRNQRWSQVIDTIFMPYLIVPVLLETFHIHQRNFKVTNKKKESDGIGLEFIVYAIPHVVLLILSVVTMVHYVNGKYGWALFYSSIIIFWVGYNTVALFYAIFFMLGRRAYRSSERIKAEENITIQHENLSYEAITVDVSENGISFWSGEPIYIPDSEPIKLIITTPYYKAKLEGKIVYVKDQNKGWCYSAEVLPVDDENKRQYTQIIYDRTHTLPKKMDMWITAYDDMIRNIRNRLFHPFLHRRKMPRIQIDRQITFEDGGTCKLVDFNYHYFSVSNFNDNGSLNEKITYKTESGILLILKRTGVYKQNSSQELLELVNLKSLIKENRLHQVLNDIINDDKDGG